MRRLLVVMAVVLAMAAIGGVASAQVNGGVNPLGSGYRP